VTIDGKITLMIIVVVTGVRLVFSYLDHVKAHIIAYKVKFDDETQKNL
jgi:uncharacterized protein YebE (UPF0316 family)